MYLCNLFVSDTFQVFNGHMMLVVLVLGSAGLKDPGFQMGSASTKDRVGTQSLLTP